MIALAVDRARARWPPSGRSSTGCGAPIVEFDLFRNRPYFGATATAFCLVGAWWAVIYFQPQYLQDVRGHSPLVCGLEVLPITVPMVFVSPFSGRLIAKFGPRLLMTVGMATGTAGMLVLTTIDATTSYAVLLVGYVLFGIALGFVYAPMSTAAMAAMPGDKVGHRLRRPLDGAAARRGRSPWPGPGRSSTPCSAPGTPSPARWPALPGSPWG